MNRTETLIAEHGGAFYIHFIRDLMEKRRTRRYVEIGVRTGELLSNVSADSVIGVDPFFVIDANIMSGKKHVFLFQETSDEFFQRGVTDTLLNGKPEVVVLDGLHKFDYLLRDFYNAERTCAPSSLIIVHDCLPLTEVMAQRSEAVLHTREEGNPYAGWWTGDVWKLVPILEQHRPDLRITLVDCPPTGLVCISNLDPTQTLLKDKYLDIVTEYAARANDRAALASFYEHRTIVRSSNVLNEMDNTLYFRI